VRKTALIFFLALFLRGALIFIWHQTGHGHHISDDGTGYYDLAQNLITGNGFSSYGKATTHRPPLYPFFIAFFMKLQAPFPLGIQMGQAVLGALSCVILFLLGEQVFDERVGLTASLIQSVDYASVREVVATMPEILFVFFLLASFYSLERGAREGRGRWFGAAGIFVGLSLLTRETLLLFIPVIIFWMMRLDRPWKLRLGGVGVFLVALSLTLAPWIVRNSLVVGKPVLVTTRAGHTFYLANNPRTTGGRTGGDWDYLHDTSFPVGDPNLPPFESLEANRYLFSQGWNFIQTQPRSFLRLMGRKIVNMWRPYQADSPLVAKGATALTYLPVMILGLTGIFLTRKRWRELFLFHSILLYIFSLHAVLIAIIRYRYPAMPIFSLFAAFALVWIWEKRRIRLASLAPQ